MNMHCSRGCLKGWKSVLCVGVLIASSATAGVTGAASPQSGSGKSGAVLTTLAAPFGHHTDGLDAMVKRQNIRALVLINPIGFFYDNGQPMGIMYDALRSLERYMNEQMKTGAMKVQVTAQADQERVQAETASQARQAEAQRDLEVKKAQYAELVKRQQAQADKAYEIQANVMQQQVTAEAVKVQQVEKEQQVKVQEAEILRREKELIATVLKGAEIERQRIETLAAAEKQRTIVEADGRASAIRAQGEAEAEIIFKKGDAEARAMNVKAEAYQEYNQAAVVDKLITGLPEVVKALASPLANVDKITVVSTGNGHSAGLNKITGDITEMAAQVPALFEALSGMQMSELLGKIRLIGDKAGKEEKPVAGGQ